MRHTVLVSLTALIGAALLLAACTGSSKGTPTAPAATGESNEPPSLTRTVVQTFLVEGSDNDDSRPGQCLDPSLAAGWRADAWRCFVATEVHDPCFQTDHGVVCGADPIEGGGAFLVDLGQALPTRGAVDADSGYWLLELASGATCRFVTGATGGVEGQRANYHCTDDTWVIGDVSDGQPLTVAVAPLDQILDPAFQLDDAPIVELRTAWQ